MPTVEHQQLYSLLDGMVVDSQASFTFDAISGAFKGSDETPPLRDISLELTLELVGLLRQLWAHRLDVLLGKSQPRHAEIYQDAQLHAPGWPGFLPERSSSKMRLIAQNCVVQAKQFSSSLDALDVAANAAISNRQEVD